MNSYPKSKKIFERASRIVPAGVSTNTRARDPHPLYFERAKGARAWDADGVRHLDIVMGNGAVLLGHGHEAVTEAVVRAAEAGLTCGVESALMAEAAETLVSAAAWPDLVRFTNTGTEAVQHALHIARHATGRTRIAKVEGSYHGWSDEVFVSVWVDPAMAGPVSNITPQAQFAGQRSELVAETLVLPFNNVEESVAALDQAGGEIAAILLEPTLIDVGFIPGRTAYLQALRNAADRHGIVLVFDELLTGFNVAVGGVSALSGGCSGPCPLRESDCERLPARRGSRPGRPVADDRTREWPGFRGNVQRTCDLRRGRCRDAPHPGHRQGTEGDGFPLREAEIHVRDACRKSRDPCEVRDRRIAFPLVFLRQSHR